MILTDEQAIAIVKRESEKVSTPILAARTLAKELGWEVVDASQTKTQVHKSIMDIVLTYLK